MAVENGASLQQDGEAQLPNGSHHQDINDDKMTPVAVIGMACKFPGEATSVEAFWKMLVEGRSALSAVPPGRFNVETYETSGKPRGGMINGAKAHFLKDDISAFDAPFFSVSPQEAACMDPQQRMLLEVSYHALENSGITPSSIANSRTSVYIGSFMHDYDIMMMRDPELRGKYTAVGTGSSMLATRMSWFYNLQGASMTVDTACSSSLTAVHLACQELRSGAADMALVGGCNVFFDPAIWSDIADMGILTPDGVPRCFDKDANGYSRGEGIGMVVLKRVTDSISADNTIRAVVRASGVNCDGRTPGITQPSDVSQARLMNAVYEAGGLDRRRTKFYEAHGTGTPVGDLLEARAVHDGLQTSRERDPLYIGAVKTNIGHTEGAAGISGFIKTVLVLERGIIPSNCHFKEPNRKIDTAEWNVVLPAESTVWPGDGLRRASQNSFGYGGANAHVVLDDAYNYLKVRGLKARHQTCTSPKVSISEAQIQKQLTNGAPNGTHVTNGESDGTRQFRLIVASAPDQEGLKRMKRTIHDHLQGPSCFKNRGEYISDASYTLAKHRDVALWRTSVVLDLNGGEQCDAWDQVPKPVRSSHQPQIGFVFTGQGAQWPRMGIELIEYPVFRNSLEAAGNQFHKLGCSWSILDELHRSEMSPSPDIVQPLCTALQIALVELLRDWKVTPAAVAGHSSGEIAAAFCAGYISRETAWTLSYFRGVVSAEASKQGDGAMLSVNLSEEEASRYLNPTEGESSDEYATIACINSQRNVTISGSRRKISSLAADLSDYGVTNRKLNVKTAYHSARMMKAAKKYESLLQGNFTPGVRNTRTVLFSTVTGNEISVEQVSKAGHWVQSLTSPVQFAAALDKMKSQSYMSSTSSTGTLVASNLSSLIEIGPHSALKGPLRDLTTQSGGSDSISYKSVLSRDANALQTALDAAGSLFSLGYEVDVIRVNGFNNTPDKPQMLIDLPSYPFNRKRKYWQEGPRNRELRLRKQPYHEILGWRALNTNDPEPELRWKASISAAVVPWIKDHVVNGTIILPAAAMISMAFEAARRTVPEGKSATKYAVHDVRCLAAITVPASGSTDTQIVLQPTESSEEATSLKYSFRIYSLSQDKWTQACKGIVSVEYSAYLPPYLKRSPNSQVSEDQGSSVPTDEMYRHFGALGVDFGDSFRRLKDIHVNDFNEAFARVNLFNNDTSDSHDSTQSYLVHPCTLDAIFQTSLASSYKPHGRDTSSPVISCIRSLEISPQEPGTDRSAQYSVYGNETESDSRSKKNYVLASDPIDGSPRIKADFETVYLEQRQDEELVERDPEQLFHAIEWKPDLNVLSLEDIQRHCTRAIRTTDNPSYHACTREKTDLALLTMYKAYDALAHKQLSADKPHMQKYAEWARHIVDGLDVDESADESLAKIQRLADDPTAIEQTAAAVAGSGPEGEMLLRIVTNYQAIMAGEVDPLDLLFSDDILTRVYASMSSDNMNFEQTAGYVDALAHKNPSLRVLEIGAGTGGATARIIDALVKGTQKESPASTTIPRFEEYMFTDISPSFFNKARKRFSDVVDRMSFKTLNVENDPMTQGFTAGSYDVIVASNVLHATADVKKTLKNARKLLKPGGKLLLHEIVDKTFIVPTFVHGLLSGWWLSTEKERRWGPLLSVLQWNAYLADSNFSGIDLEFQDTMKGNSWSSVLVSTAKSSPPAHIPATRFVVALQNESEIQRKIADLLESIIEKTFSGAACTRVDIANTSKSSLAGAVCFVIPEIERPLLDGIHEPELSGLQELVNSAQAIVWVGTYRDARYEDAVSSLVHGFARVARNEFRGSRFTTLLLQGPVDPSNAVQRIVDVYMNTASDDDDAYEPEYVERENVLCIGRVVDSGAINEYFKAGGNLADGHTTQADSLTNGHATSVETNGDAKADSAPKTNGVNGALSSSELPTQPAILDSNATYLVAGGMGGLGRCIARWIVSRGGKYMILLSRKGTSTEEAKEFIKSLAAQGVEAVAPACDVSDASSLAAVIDSCNAKMPPIKGCINAAMFPDPNDLSVDKFLLPNLEATLAPKVRGSLNLYSVLPTDIDFFILLSSIAGMIGLPKQGPYAMGNTYQNALAHQLTAAGVPAVSIDLGAMIDDGYLLDQPAETLERLTKLGCVGMKRYQFETLLDYYGNAATFPLKKPGECQVICGLDSPRGRDKRTTQRWFWAKEKRMRHLWQRRGDGLSAAIPDKSAKTEKDYKRLFAAAGDLAKRQAISLEVINLRLASELGIEVGDIDIEKSINSYGLDSLGAVDMNTYLRKELDVVVGVFEIFEKRSVREFAMRVAEIGGEGGKAQDGQ